MEADLDALAREPAERGGHVRLVDPVGRVEQPVPEAAPGAPAAAIDVDDSPRPLGGGRDEALKMAIVLARQEEARGPRGAPPRIAEAAAGKAPAGVEEVESGLLEAD